MAAEAEADAIDSAARPKQDGEKAWSFAAKFIVTYW